MRDWKLCIPSCNSFIVNGGTARIIGEGYIPDHTDSGERIMSITETSSKIYEPATYEQAISDSIHSRQWKEAIEEEIQNLEDHQT